MEIGILISIVACVLSIISFFFSRNDKSKQEEGTSQYKMGVIETKIDTISKQIQQLVDKFDKYDVEVDEKITKAIETHIREYHKGE